MSYAICQFPFFICPVEYSETTDSLNYACEPPPPVFVLTEYSLPPSVARILGLVSYSLLALVAKILVLESYSLPRLVARILGLVS